MSTEQENKYKINEIKENNIVVVGDGTVINPTDKPTLPIYQSLGLRSSELFTARETELAWVLAGVQLGRSVTLWGPGRRLNHGGGWQWRSYHLRMGGDCYSSMALKSWIKRWG